MLIQPYVKDELRFAYCYRVYLRWRTYRARPQAILAGLDKSVLTDIGERYGIHVLEAASNETDVLALVSLKPGESISACASKLKGQMSKWLREAQHLAQPVDQLSSGYFACTIGKSSRLMVEQYLERQSAHHGYAERVRPPVFSTSYEVSQSDESHLTPEHSIVKAQYHLVFATAWRRGIFGEAEGRAIAQLWRNLTLRAVLLKVSFLPDHVHVAVRAHPAVAPAELALELMNTAQQFVFANFAGALLQAKVERLWQPSAYLGSYGELTSPQLRRYIENFGVITDGLTLDSADQTGERLEFENAP